MKSIPSLPLLFSLFPLFKQSSVGQDVYLRKQGIQNSSCI